MFQATAIPITFKKGGGKTCEPLFSRDSNGKPEILLDISMMPFLSCCAGATGIFGKQCIRKDASQSVGKRLGKKATKKWAVSRPPIFNYRLINQDSGWEWCPFI